MCISGNCSVTSVSRATPVAPIPTPSASHTFVSPPPPPQRASARLPGQIKTKRKYTTPAEADIKLMQKKIQKNQEAAEFKKDIYEKVAGLKRDCSDEKIDEFVKTVKARREGAGLTSNERYNEGTWVDGLLRASFKHPQYSKIADALDGGKKRYIEQQPAFRAVESAPELLASQPVSGQTLCVAGTLSSWRGAGATNQLVTILEKNGSTITPMPNISAAIQQQLGPDQGANYMQSSCDNTGRVDTITTDGKSPTTSTFYDMIKSYTLAVPQQLAAIGTKLFGQSWSVATLPQQAVFAPVYSDYAVKISSAATGQFNSSDTGTALYTPTTATAPEVMSHEDGTFSVYQTRDTPGLYKTDFDATGKQGATTEINGGISVGPVVASPTPIPLAANFSILMSPGKNGNAPAYYRLQLGNPKILSNTSLGTEPNTAASPAIAQCGTQTPDRYCYARESYTQATNMWAVVYDCIDASTGGSILGGPQTLKSFPPTITQPTPQIGCFADGSMLLTVLDTNQMPYYIPIRLVNTTGEAPVVIIENIPLNLGGTLTQITSAMVSFSNNTAVLQFTSYNGFKVVYTVNGSDVPLFSQFPAGAIYNMSISIGNATKGDAPTIEGCTEDDLCGFGMPESPLQETFTTSGISWQIILGCILGAAALVGTAATVVGVKVVMPLRKKRRELNKKEENRRQRKRAKKAQDAQTKADEKAATPAPAAANPHADVEFLSKRVKKLQLTEVAVEDEEKMIDEM